MVNYTLIIRKENIFEQFLEIFVEIKESSLFQCICFLFRVHVNNRTFFMSNCYTDAPRTTCERYAAIWQWDGGKQILTIVLFERRNKGCKERVWKVIEVVRMFPKNMYARAHGGVYRNYCPAATHVAENKRNIARRNVFFILVSNVLYVATFVIVRLQIKHYFCSRKIGNRILSKPENVK